MITFDFEKKKRLHKQILNIQKEISARITYINNGGCIHFAYYLSKRLKELAIPHKVYFLNIHHNIEEGDTVDHVMVKVDGIGLIDGTKINKSFSNYGKRKHTPNLEKIRFHNNWRTTYKKTQNQVLQNIIRKHLNGY